MGHQGEFFEFQEDATLEKVVVRFFFFFKRPQLLNLMWSAWELGLDEFLNLMWSCLGARTG